MGLLIGPGYVAVQTGAVDRLIVEAERNDLFITLLDFQFFIVQRGRSYPGRGAGLEAAHIKAILAQPVTKPLCGRLPKSSALFLVFANEDLAVHKGAGGQHNSFCAYLPASLCHNTNDRTIFNEKIDHSVHEEGKVLCVFKKFFGLS